MLCGCVYEDDSDCGDGSIAGTGEGVKLDFSFTNNKEAQNLFANQINDVRVYIFDQASGILRYIVDLDREDIVRGEIAVDIPSGTYSIVAWASNAEDMMADGFRAAWADDTDGDGQTNEYDDISKDVTTLKDFRMMLTYDQVPDGEAGDVTPKIANFGDLYYAEGDNLVIDRKQDQTIYFNFTKNTSVLNVTVGGMQHFGAATRATGDSIPPVNLFVLGNNGIMENNNSTDNNAQRMRYNPYNQTMTTDTLTTSIKSMRLDLDEQSQDDVKLYLHNPDDHSDVINPMGLLDVILATCDDQGNTVYNNQQDIDKEDEFNIEITIATDLTVSVSVNGFTPVVLTPQQSDAEKTPNKTE